MSSNESYIYIFSPLLDSTTVYSEYSSSLTGYNQLFCWTGYCFPALKYYYQAFIVNASSTGFYKIISNSSMDTYGLMYKNSFNSSDPSRNVVVSDDDSGGNNQFQLEVYIDAAIKFILVVTTHWKKVTGAFSIGVTGEGSVTFIGV
jgi:hypothetical protein